jgi:hypothetical protein
MGITHRTLGNSILIFSISLLFSCKSQEVALKNYKVNENYTCSGTLCKKGITLGEKEFSINISKAILKKKTHVFQLQGQIIIDGTGVPYAQWYIAHRPNDETLELEPIPNSSTDENGNFNFKMKLEGSKLLSTYTIGSPLQLFDVTMVW